MGKEALIALAWLALSFEKIQGFRVDEQSTAIYVAPALATPIDPIKTMSPTLRRTPPSFPYPDDP